MKRKPPPSRLSKILEKYLHPRGVRFYNSKTGEDIDYLRIYQINEAYRSRLCKKVTVV